jgi:predicted PurR-regulated permease PerM
MPPKFTFNRELITRVFFFVTFAFLLYQVFLLAKPFLPSILLAAMVAITFYPWHIRVRRWVKNPPAAALIMTIGTALMALVPIIAITWFVLREAHNIIPISQRILQEINNGELYLLIEKMPPPLDRLTYKIMAFLTNLEIDITPLIMDTLQRVGSWFSDLGVLLARNAIFTFFKIIIFFVSLFFAYLDGEVFMRWSINLLPMELSHKNALAKRAYDTFRAVTAGVFITAAAQGLLATIGFLIAGVNLPVLLGLAVGAVSLLGASFLITLPVALFMFKDSVAWGIFLLIWGAVVVGWLDNVLKPILIGSRARMPFVLVFFSILGGIKMYGLMGLILGPVLIASLMTFIKIYRDAYEAMSQ